MAICSSCSAGAVVKPDSESRDRLGRTQDANSLIRTHPTRLEQRRELSEGPAKDLLKILIYRYLT